MTDVDDQGHDDRDSFAARRHEELTRAPKSDEGDAAPRITTDDRGDGITRIDVADTAAVRPGGGTSGEAAGA